MNTARYWSEIPKQTFLKENGQIGDCWRCAIAAVQLSRITPLPGGGGYMTSNSVTLHNRSGLSEDEMRGVAVAEALNLKPGFSVDQVLVKIIPAP